MEKKVKSRVKPILTALLIAAAFAFAVLGMTAATGAYRSAVNAEPAVHSHDGYTEWTSKNSLPTEAGNYFLSADVTIASGTWSVPSGTTNLCLNGHGIIGNSGNSVIYVESGATLYLHDCGDAVHKYTVDANHLATVNDALEGDEGVNYYTFTGGYITGGKRTAVNSKGGGVDIEGGTLYLNGGTIIGNSADRGGGVRCGGTFVMNGGAIRNNNAKTASGGGQRNGGGLFINTTFTMNGGVITENWCANAGGALLLQSTATSFIMNGGAIVNNYNRGLSNNMGQKPVQIGTEAVLEGNVDNDGNPCDIWLLQNGNKIQLIGERKNTTPIAVMMGTPGVFTSGLSGNGTLAQFTSTNDNYFVDSGAGGEAQLSEKVASVTADEKETFYGDISSALNAWTDGSTLKLFKDVTARITVTDGNKTLDLNNHSITYTSGTVIIVSGGTLRITDQSAAKTTHYYTPNATGVATLSNTDTGYRFEGGFITGGVNNNNRGGGLSISGTGSVVFDSGTIFANKAGWGGGIHTSGSGSLTIEGTAAIIGNYSSGNYTSGGGMFMEGSCAVTMTGGSIRHNSAQYSGGGVRDCISESTGVRFTMTGGEITGNSSANDQGNGFCFDMATTFNIGGTARIIGNQGTNDLYFYNDRYLTVVAPFEEGAMIGVLLQGVTGAFTSGWSTYMDGKDPADYFTPSNADEEYIVYLTEGGEAAVKLNVLFEGEGTEASPYLIKTSDDWDALSEYIKNGKTFYNGKYFRLTDDITVTTTLGFRPGSSDNEDRVFSGFFDGDGHTLNVNINTNAFAAPFAIVYNTTIENLHVTGTVNSSGAHASGLVGATKASTLLGASTLTVRNVTVSVDVHGGSHTAGVIGHAHKASIVMENVTFDGSIYATSLQGGYVGWGGVSGGEKFSMTLKDCLFLGTYNTAVAFNPVAYASGQGMVTLTNDFLTMSLGSGGSPVATSGSGSVELIAASVASGETMTYYSDFNAAFTDWRLSSGGTLKLYKDVELTSSQDKFTAPYEWTLDLNGKTLTVKGDSFLTAGGNSSANGYGQGATVTIDDTSESGGGVIDGNDHNTGGNLFFIQYGGVLNFKNGTVRNFRQGWGVILVKENGTVNMYDGFTISGNRANNGGGGALFVDGTGVFNMYGGVIENNNGAGGKGGGIFIAGGDSVVNLYGGIIRNNTASSAGGGIAYTNGTLNILGEVTIEGNTVSGTANNVYVASGKTINITADFSATAPIGVTLADGEGTFTSGWATYFTEADPADYFFSENANYIIVTNADGEAAVGPREIDPSEVTETDYEGDYDGAAHSASVEGPDGSTVAYGTAEGTYTLDTCPSYTNAGTYTVYYKITKTYYNPYYGSLTVTIGKIDATVTVTGHTSTVDYDGTAHTVTGYDVAFDTTLYTANDFTFSGAATATQTNAGTANMGLAASQFSNVSGNFDTVTFIIASDGFQTVEPINAVVTVIGGNATLDYDGLYHSVEGYTATADTDLYNVDEDVAFSGTNFAMAKDVGTTLLGLKSNMFANTNANFATVTFVVTDGFITINAIDLVIIVKGKVGTAAYDGTAHTVEGFEVTSDKPLFNVAKKIVFSGAATATRTEAGTAYMGLTADMFSYYDPNFSSVSFRIVDGYQTIVPAEVTVTVTGNSAVYGYDGAEHTVEGFTAVASSDLFDVTKDFTFSGEAKATVKDIGTAYMGLTAESFASANDNFNVTFEVVDGYVTVESAPVTVTITGNNAVYGYDGTAHTVEGFTAVASIDLYDVEKDFAFSGEATATATDLGTAYMGLTAEMFQNVNENFENVIFVVEDGFVTVEPASVTVTITGNNGTFDYDGTAHKAEGYKVVFDNALYTEEDFTFGGNALATQTDVGTAYMGLTIEQFANNNENFTVTFVVEDGYITVEPIDVTVTVTGNNGTFDYDGTAHTVEGYEVVFDNALYTEEDFTFNGSATVAQTDAGTANMGLTIEQFANNNENFTVTFEVVDGYITVNPIDVTVTVTGKNGTFDYDGKAHTVEGYEVAFDNALYTEADFTFGGNATITLTNAGTVNMNLAAGQFANANANFANVTFIVTDGFVTVNPIDVTVTVTGKNGTFDYDGKAHTVEGYEVAFDNALYTEADFTFGGNATITLTDAGTVNMNLAAGQFANTNANFANVTFNVTDGYITVTPIDVTVTVTGKNDTVTYDGKAHTVEGYELTFDNALYTAADFTFGGNATITLTDAGTVNMNLAAGQFTNTNANFANVTFIVTDGYLTVDPAEVTFIKLPQVAELKYTGTPQQLIDGGVVEGGTILYALGASGAAPADASFGTALPTAIGIATYYVWYKVEADENHIDFAPVCLTAKIDEDDSALKGIVYGSDGETPVDGATVTLIKGNERVDTFVTAFDGRYRFQVSAGIYNLVVEYENVTVTLLVTVSQETVKDVLMPDGITESILEVDDEESFGVAVGGLDEEAYAIRKSENVPADKVVSVVMKVDAKVDEAAESALSIIEAAADQTLVFYEIKVEKTVDSVTTTLDETANVLEIAIPYNKTNKKGITVYSYHGAKVTTFTESDSRRSGTFRVDKENGYVYVYSNRFSTYAIGYTPYYRVNTEVSLGSYGGTATVTLTNKEDGKVYVREGVNVGKLSFTDIPAGEYTMTVTWTDGAENSITMPVSVKAKAEKTSGSSDVEPALANENDLKTEDKALLNSKKSEGSKGSRDDDESSKGAPEADAPKGSDDNFSKGEEDEDSKGGKKDGSKGRNEEEDSKGIKGCSKGKAEDEDEENESKETSKGKAEQAAILSQRTRERRNE